MRNLFVIVSALAVSGALVSASDRDNLSIRAVVSDAAHSTLVIDGTNFCAFPRVSVAGLTLAVGQVSKTSIVATMPAVSAGTYRLTVSCEPERGKGEGRADSIDIALGGTASAAGLPSTIQLVQTVLGIDTCCQGWKTQGGNWDVLHPNFNVSIDKKSATSLLRVHWTDNVGQLGQTWCNVGIFMDDALDYAQNACVASWYGPGPFSFSAGGPSFGQRELSCNITGAAQGAHTFTVKDRSTYCYYGNYPFDKDGFRREISVEEIEPAHKNSRREVNG